MPLHAPSPSSWLQTLLVAGFAMALTALTGGCGDSGPAPGAATNTAQANRRRSDALLRNVLLLLDNQRHGGQVRLSPAERREVQLELEGTLNHWLRQAELVDDLVVPERTERVLRALAERGQLRADQLQDVHLQRFTVEDVQHIQSCMLLAEIASYARGTDVDDVSRARSLFDWVVRNIELVPADDPDHAALLAFTGPVFNSALLIGKGTQLERAWLFVLLLRQLHMQACLVGPVNPAGGFQPRWVGVLIGGELYLFDPLLGLPVPSADQAGVATLRELAAEPDAVLGRLAAVPEAAPKPAELESIALRLEAGTAFWTPRMKLLEAQFTGLERRVVLYEELGVPEALVDNSVAPTAAGGDLLERMRHAAGEPRQPFFAPEPVGLVDVPALLRAQIVAPAAAQGAQPTILQPFFVGSGALGEARNLQLRGRWADAIQRYQNVLQLHAEIQTRPAEFEFPERYFAGLAREMATYWIGTCKYEQGEYALAAQNWLGPYRERFPEGKWINGASYLLARCWEAEAARAGSDKGELRPRIQEAIDLLGSTTSPQRFGDRLRAQRLQQLLQ